MLRLSPPVAATWSWLQLDATSMRPNDAAGCRRPSSAAATRRLHRLPVRQPSPPPSLALKRALARACSHAAVAQRCDPRRGAVPRQEAAAGPRAADAGAAVAARISSVHPQFHLFVQPTVCQVLAAVV